MGVRKRGRHDDTAKKACPLFLLDIVKLSRGKRGARHVVPPQGFLPAFVHAADKVLPVRIRHQTHHSEGHVGVPIFFVQAKLLDNGMVKYQ